MMMNFGHKLIQGLVSEQLVCTNLLCMIFGSLTQILDISVSNVTEATTFFHVHITMHVAICSIIVAIHS